MYSSDAGWIYFDKTADNPKQYWKLSAKTASEDFLRDGDTVKFDNAVWSSSSYLQRCDGYADCASVSV